MATWQSYTAERQNHTVTGDVRYNPNVYSPQLNNERDIAVWLPQSYETSEKRYPVLYMHDGQNVFDAETSFSGEWHVDETLTQLGIEVIVVAIPNKGAERMSEYNPFMGWKAHGKGADYIDFITNTLKPIIDTDFRTLPDAPNTGIAGSSMGGLISLYGYLARPDVFHLCGAFSPVVWLGGNQLQQMILQRASSCGRVYLDIGTAEGGVATKRNPKRKYTAQQASDYYANGVKQLNEAFIHRGYMDDSLMFVVDEGAQHNEPAWAKRFPEAVQFLFG